MVRNAANLNSEQMQVIAKEFDLSETAFVTEENEHSATVRIFTSGQELPFAGHPTLGTASVLNKTKQPFTLPLKMGDMLVIEANGIGWLDAPEITFKDSMSEQIVAQLYFVFAGR